MILHGSMEFYSNNKFVKLSDLNDGDTITMYDKNRQSFECVVYKRNEYKAFNKYHFGNGQGNFIDIPVTAKNEWDTYDSHIRTSNLYLNRSLAIQPSYEDNMLINIRDPHYFFLGCIISNWGYYKKQTPNKIQFLMENYQFWNYQLFFERYGFYKVDYTYRRGRKVSVIEKEASQEEIEQLIEEMKDYKNLNNAQKADMFYGYYTCRDTSLQHIIKENERFTAGFVEESYKPSGFWLQNVQYRTPAHLNNRSKNSEKPYYELTFNHKEGFPDDIFSKTMTKRWTLTSIEKNVPDNNTYDVYLIGPGTIANGFMTSSGIIIYLNYDEEGYLEWDFGNVNQGVEPPSPDDEIIDFSNISGDGNPVYDNMIWEMGDIKDGVTPPPPDSDEYDFHTLDLTPAPDDYEHDFNNTDSAIPVDTKVWDLGDLADGVNPPGPDTDDYEFADSEYIPPTEDNFDYDFNLIYNMENMEPIDNTPDDEKYDFSDVVRLKETPDVLWDFDDISDGIDHGPNDEIEDFDDINDGLVPSGGDDDEMYDFNKD